MEGLGVGAKGRAGVGHQSASMSPEKLQFKGRVKIWVLVRTGAGLKFGVRSVLSIKVGVEMKMNSCKSYYL